MNEPELAAIAKECQLLAKDLAPFQNYGVIPVVSGEGTPSPKNPELRSRDVTRITNALLNAGNALEFLTRDKKVN